MGMNSDPKMLAHFGAGYARRCCRTLRARQQRAADAPLVAGAKHLTTSGFSSHRPPASLLIRSALDSQGVGNGVKP